MPAVIKNVSKDCWRTFREESIKHGVTSGSMLDMLVKEHVKNEMGRKDAWDYILGISKPVITKKQADIIRKSAEELRRGLKMRV